MNFQVETTRRAEQDVNQIVAWLFERSPQGAAVWYDAWEIALAFLAKNPHATALAPEDADHEEDIRNWTFGTSGGRRYRVLFIIRGATVYITNVRGAGQQLVPKEDLDKPRE